MKHSLYQICLMMVLVKACFITIDITSLDHLMVGYRKFVTKPAIMDCQSAKLLKITNLSVPVV